MRVWLWLFVLGAAGCSFEHGQVAPQDGAIEIDAIDAPPSCKTFSSQLDTCAMSESTVDLTLTGMNTYDTTTGMLTTGANPIPVTRINIAGKAGPLEVVLVRDFHMTANARLRATGSMPLAIVAFGTITIDAGAVIDVAAGGAGARATCTDGAAVGANQGGGAGGGGGGGFAAAGGGGGNGDSDGGSAAAGGAGGAAFGVMPPGPLGGCAGARGGNGDANGGAGGAGGGAIYLAAAVRIDLAPGSSINAGGAGGEGGDVGGAFSDGDAGGGGGGSGGMIMIESPIVRSAGALAANGGGGGEASGGGGAGDNGSPAGITTTIGRAFPAAMRLSRMNPARPTVLHDASESPPPWIR